MKRSALKQIIKEELKEVKSKMQYLVILDDKEKKIFIFSESGWRRFDNDIRNLWGAIEGNLKLEVITGADVNYMIQEKGYKKSKNMTLTLKLL